MDRIEKKGLPTEDDEMLDMALGYMNNTEAQNIGAGSKIRMSHIYLTVIIIVMLNVICLFAVRRHMKR
jgi:hypothetical protein